MTFLLARFCWFPSNALWMTFRNRAAWLQLVEHGILNDAIFQRCSVGRTCATCLIHQQHRVSAVPGCGESAGRVAFSGSVIVSGFPVTGEIRFSPLETTGPMLANSINKGASHFISENGPVPGDYDVIIECLPAAATKAALAESVVPLVWKLKRRIEAGTELESDFFLDPMSATESE